LKNCSSFEELLSSYVDNDLEDCDVLLVEEHLESCPHCVGLLKLYREISKSVADSKVSEPLGLNDRIMEKIKNPEVIQGSIKADTLVIFPKNYGWGTRWAEDKVWGIFKADQQTQQLWTLMQTTLEKHGLNTDIIYEDTNYPPPSTYQNIYHYQEYTQK